MNQLMKADVQMTSLDIAELTGKQHPHIMRDIRNEIEALGEEIGASIFGLTSYKDKSNRDSPCYKFGKDGAMQLALKYDAVTRYKVIKHIEELEQSLQKPLTAREQLQLIMQANEETAQRVDVIEEKLEHVISNMRIDGVQEEELGRRGRAKVIEVLGGNNSPAYAAISRKVFPKLWNEFKEYFKIPRYAELPKALYGEGLRFVDMWQPSTLLRMEIEQYNRQTQLKLVK